MHIYSLRTSYLVNIMSSDDGVKHGVEVIQQVDHLHTDRGGSVTTFTIPAARSTR